MQGLVTRRQFRRVPVPLREAEVYAQVADRVGVSEPTVRKWLGYAAVPQELMDLVASGRLTAPTVMRISEVVPDPKRALDIATRVAEMGPVKREHDRIVAAAEELPSTPATTASTTSGSSSPPRNHGRAPTPPTSPRSASIAV